MGVDSTDRCTGSKQCTHLRISRHLVELLLHAQVLSLQACLFLLCQMDGILEHAALDLPFRTLATRLHPQLLQHVLQVTNCARRRLVSTL